MLVRKITNVLGISRSPEAQKRSLEEIVREGARKLLQQAIETEVALYLEEQQQEIDCDGRRLVVRNGKMPARSVLTGVGPLTIQQPRIRDRRDGLRFTSAILPPYMRRTPSINNLIPVLYLKGVSSGDFSEALTAILGENAPGLSAANICRLKEVWEAEFTEWSQRDLSGKRYVYIWADGIYFNVRLGEDRPCLLVLIGALEDGRKEVIAILDGIRESTLSWMELLRDLKKRGLKEWPRLAVGDGALGFWAALEEEFSSTRQQRCWVHKTANVLDKMPKSIQGYAKKLIHEIFMAPTKQKALEAYKTFIDTFEAKYPKACQCLEKDKEALFAFYDFPASHWQHIRTTNPIESTFATIRHRTRQTKGCGSRMATLTMVFKLLSEAERGWRKLRGHELVEKVLNGVKFINGQMEKNVEVVA